MDGRLDQERERRELERRAYGRDGPVLTAAEVARLTMLHASASSDPVDEDAGGLLDAPPPADSDAPPPGDSDAPPPAGPAPRVADRAARGQWKRPRYRVGGIAALVLIGIAIGVAIPRAPDAGIALGPGDAQRRDKVVASSIDDDPGSVVLLARSGSALLWGVTQAGGELVCVVLDVRTVALERRCGFRTTLLTQPLEVAVQTSPTTDGDVTAVQGLLALTGAGVPLGNLQQRTYALTPDPDLDPSEAAAWHRIMRAEKFRNLTLVGRAADLPVWLGYRDQDHFCLLAEDQGIREVCSEQGDGTVIGLGEERPALTLNLPAAAEHAAFRVDYWTGRTASYLVVTADAEPAPVLGPRPGG